MRIPNYSIFLIFFLTTLVWGIENYVSKFGQEVLSKCDLIVQGMPVQTRKLPHGGTKVIEFSVTEIYQGQIALGQVIYLYTLSDITFANQEKWIVFLKKMSFRHNFEMIGDFSLQEHDAVAKIQTLQNLLKLELIPDINQRKIAYLDYCLNNLIHSESWVRAHALGEWKHFLKYYDGLLNTIYLEKLASICEGIPELSFRKEIEKDIIRLKRKLKN